MTDDPHRSRIEMQKALANNPEAAVLVTVERSAPATQAGTESHLLFDYDRGGSMSRERTRQRVIERMIERWPDAAARAFGRVGVNG